MSLTLIDFYNRFFAPLPEAVNSPELAQETKTAFQSLVFELQRLLEQQMVYPFLQVLVRPMYEIEKISKQPTAYFSAEFSRQAENLLISKQKILDPVRRFMSGKSKTIYDDCQSFLRQQKNNLPYLPAETLSSLQNLLAAPDCYLEDKMIAAQQHMQSLQETLRQCLESEEQQALQEIKRRRQALQNSKKFQQLSLKQQLKITDDIESFASSLDSLYLINEVRTCRRRFIEETFPALVSQLQNTPAVSLYSLLPSGNPYLLTTEEDIDTYLVKTKQALMEKIEKGSTVLS